MFACAIPNLNHSCLFPELDIRWLFILFKSTEVNDVCFPVYDIDNIPIPIYNLFFAMG